LQRNPGDLLPGRRAERAGPDNVNAAPVVVLVKPLNRLVDVAVQADLEAVDGQQLHELVVHHLFAGDGMVPDGDLEPAVIVPFLQAVQGAGEGRHVDAGAFTIDECQQMIELLAENKVEGLIAGGVPVGTRVAHKHGWIGDTHADAAIVFSPGGDFVLAVFLYRPEWLEWGVSNPLVNRMATATYNYFNPAQ